MPGDPLANEQDALLKKYYLSKEERDTTSRWSADGPSSISPFVPCAQTRIPYILRAARLQKEDILWDLGCGDGRCCTLPPRSSAAGRSASTSTLHASLRPRSAPPTRTWAISATLPHVTSWPSHRRAAKWSRGERWRRRPRRRRVWREAGSPTQLRRASSVRHVTRALAAPRLAPWRVGAVGCASSRASKGSTTASTLRRRTRSLATAAGRHRRRRNGPFTTRSVTPVSSWCRRTARASTSGRARRQPGRPCQR